MEQNGSQSRDQRAVGDAIHHLEHPHCMVCNQVINIMLKL